MHNILVCDDDHDIVAALKIYLSGGEYRVFEAYNGAEAVEAVRKNDIHLVLMDIMMPELDGIAATAAIRRESNAPIILLTAKSESSDKVLGQNVGADDYITKPFGTSELLARLPYDQRETYAVTEAERGARVLEPPPPPPRDEGMAPRDAVAAATAYLAARSDWEGRKAKSDRRAAQKRKERIRAKVRALGNGPA